MLTPQQKIQLHKQKTEPEKEENSFVCICHRCFEIMKLPKGQGRKWEFGKSKNGDTIHKCVCCGKTEGMFSYI